MAGNSRGPATVDAFLQGLPGVWRKEAALGATLLGNAASVFPRLVVDEDKFEAPEDGGRVVEFRQGGEQALYKWIAVDVYRTVFPGLGVAWKRVLPQFLRRFAVLVVVAGFALGRAGITTLVVAFGSAG